MSIGQPPLERSPQVVNGLHFFRIHLEHLLKALETTDGFVTLRFDQIKISVAPLADDAAVTYIVLCVAASVGAGVVHHIGAPRHFVESVSVVEIVTDLMLKMPRQLVIQMGTVRVIL